jgi:hypothetical protein
MDRTLPPFSVTPLPLQPFAVVERILRDRLSYFREIGQGQDLPAKIVGLCTVTVLGLSAFGFVLGLTAGQLGQAALSAVKLPLLFLVSGLVCLPTLYYFSVFFGSRLRFLQTVTLILTMQTVSAVLLLGFAPISLVFQISGAEPLFLAVMNTLLLAFSAGLGLIFLVQGVLYVQQVEPLERVSFPHWIVMFIKGGVRSLVLGGWLALYGLVGAQLSWALRPFFGGVLYGNGFWASMSNAVVDLLSLG